MHSEACVLRAADVGAALLAERGMDGAQFDKRMRERFGREYTEHREEVFRAAYERYLDARSESKASSYSRREGAFVAKAAGGDVGQAKLGKGFLSDTEIAGHKAAFAKMLGERAATNKKAARARLELAQTYAALEKTSAIGVARAIRKSGFTAGVGNTVRNFASNLIGQAYEGAVIKPVSTMIDMAVSADTRQRTTSKATLDLLAKSGYEGARDGVREAWETLRRGITPEQLERLELPPRTNSGNKYVDAYLNFLPRLPAAGDALFRGYGMKRSLASRARSLAITEAKDGKISHDDVARRTREIFNDPPSDQVLAAVADAEFLTYNNRNKLADWIEQGKSMGGEGVALAAEIPMTYTKVPTNLGLRFLDYMGGGLVRAASAGRDYLPLKVGSAALAPLDLAGMKAARSKRSELHEKMLTAFGSDEAARFENQRRFSQMFARGLVGPGLAALGAYLASQGATPGYYQKSDEDERKRDEAAGIGPGSLIINGRSYDVRWAGPAMNVLLFGATLYHAANDQASDVGDRLKKVVGATKDVAIQQTPLLENLQQFDELTSHPERWPAYLASTLKSYVPVLNLAIVRETANALDTEERRGGVAEGATVDEYMRSAGSAALDAVTRDIPVVRESLPAGRDVFGQPLQHNRFDMVTRSKDVPEDPYLNEIRRLDLGAPRVIPEKGESREAYRARAEQIGARRFDAGRLVVASDTYRRLASLPNGAELQRAVLADAAKRALDAPLELPVDREAFAHTTTAEAHKLLAVERLNADPRYSQLDKAGQEKAVELLGGVYGRAKYTPKATESRDVRELELTIARGDLEWLDEPDNLAIEIEEVFRKIENAGGITR